MKSNNREQEILMSSFSILSKEGINSITLKKVAKEAKMSVGLILHYYDSKEDLLNKLSEYVIVQCQDFYAPKINYSSNNLKQEFIKLIDHLFKPEIDEYISPLADYSIYIESLKDDKLKKRLINSVYNSRKNIGFYLDFFKRKGIIYYDNEEFLISHLMIVVDGLYYYMNFCEDEYFFNESIIAQKKLFLEMVHLKI